MTNTEALMYNFKIHTILGAKPSVSFTLEAAQDIMNEIKERDEKITELTNIIKERDSQITDLDNSIKDVCGYCCGYLEMRCFKCPIHIAKAECESKEADSKTSK